MGEVHWSTVVVEQGHASATLVKRAHPGYSSLTISIRSHLHMLRTLFAQPPVLRAERHSEQRLALLVKKVPQRVHGRHMFFKELVKETQQQLPPDQVLKREDLARLMQRCSQQWKELSPSEQAFYNRQATNRAHAQQKALADEIQETKAHLARLRHDKLSQDILDKASHLRLSSCRFEAQDLQKLEALLASPAFSKAASMGKLKTMLEPPLPPKAKAQSVLEQVEVVSVPQTASKEHRKPWLSQACQSRDDLRHCALLFESDSGRQHAYAFLFATQRPYRAHFVSLSRISDRVLPPTPPDGVPLSHAFSSVPNHLFAVQQGQYVTDQDMEVQVQDEPWVLPCLAFRANHTADAHCLAVPWGQALSKHSAPTRAPGEDREPQAKKQKVHHELLEKHPWLRNHLRKKSATPARAADTTAGSSRRSNVPATLSEEGYNQAFASLEAQRRAWQANHSRPSEDFRTTMLGGAWTLQNVGVTADAIKGYAANKDSQQFCVRFHMPKMQTFTIRKFTEIDASALALFWCAKMQHYYNLWTEQQDQHMVWTDTHLASFDAEAARLEIFGQRELSVDTQARLQALEAIMPS